MYIYIKTKNIKRIVIPEDINSLKKLKNIIKYNIGLNKKTNDFYLVYKTRIITEKNIEIIKNNTVIELNFKIKGGLPGFMDALEGFLSPILGPVYDIMLAFVEMVLLLVEFIEVFFNILKVLPSIFSPDKLIDDVMAGVIKGINFVIKNLLSNLSLNRNRNSGKDASPSVFGVSDKTRAMCLPPSIMDLIILVLCPPLVLFLKKGLNFFFQIILCSLLTYKLYYFPGFIFAAVYILC